MNIVMWIVAGGISGWVAIKYLELNESRGMVVSIAIGMIGGLLGGNELAPLLTSSTVASGSLNTTALIVALVTAGVCLVIASKLRDRFDF